MADPSYTFEDERIRMGLPGTLIHSNGSEAFIMLSIKDLPLLRKSSYNRNVNEEHVRELEGPVYRNQYTGGYQFNAMHFAVTEGTLKGFLASDADLYPLYIIDGQHRITAIENVSRANPDFSISGIMAKVSIIKNESDIQRMVEMAQNIKTLDDKDKDDISARVNFIEAIERIVSDAGESAQRMCVKRAKTSPLLRDYAVINQIRGMTVPELQESMLEIGKSYKQRWESMNISPTTALGLVALKTGLYQLMDCESTWIRKVGRSTLKKRAIPLAARKSSKKQQIFDFEEDDDQSSSSSSIMEKPLIKKNASKKSLGSGLSKPFRLSKPGESSPDSLINKKRTLNSGEKMATIPKKTKRCFF